MLRLITGADGTGKTLMAIQLLKEMSEQNERLRKEGKPTRGLYTDIDGCRVPGVGLAKPDWREMPRGSFIVYDEAHKIFPATGKPGRSDDPRIREFDEHRHRGYDFVFVTQWPSKIHHEIRQMVQDHKHLTRAFGMGRSGMRAWNRCQPDPYDEKVQETAQEEIWVHPADCFGLYDSAEVHTDSYKFRMPKKIWQAVSRVVVLLLVGWGLWEFVFKPDPPVAKAQAGAAAEAQAPAGAGAPPRASGFSLSDVVEVTGSYGYAESPRAPKIVGYTLGRRCRIFVADGSQLDLSDSECRKAVEDGIPINLFAYQSGGAGLRNEQQQQQPAATVQPPSLVSALLNGPTTLAPYGGVGLNKGEAAPVGEFSMR